MQFLKKTLRALLLCALTLYFTMAATMLVVRYLVLPHVNEWRPQIEQRLSTEFGSQVTVDSLSANWSGLNPTLSLENLSVRSPQGDTLLNIPRADALVSWRSLLALDLRLQHLDVRGIDITVEKQQDGNISIAGYVLNLEGTTPFKLDGDTLAMRWLLGQGEIAVHDATLRWSDLQRGAPELKFSGVDFALTNGLFSHRLFIRGKAPEAIAQDFEFIVRADHVLSRLGAKAGRHAEIYFAVQDLSPHGLAPWLDLPEIAGRFAGRAWIDVQNGKLASTVVDIAGSKVGTSISASSPTALFAQQAQLRVSGLLGDLLPMFKSDLLAVSSSAQAAIDIHASAQGATVESAFFEPSLVVVEKMDLGLIIKNPHGPVFAHVSGLKLSNRHLELNLQGDWQAGGASGAGVADMTGMITRLSTSELYRYLTVETTKDARDWLRDSLVQGEFKQAAITLKGDLAEFPFNQPHEKGVFKIDGRYENLTLDYSGPKAGAKGWPALAYADGSILISQLGLKMHSDTGTLLGSNGERLKLENLDVNIPDMGLNPLLAVNMNLKSEGSLFLSVLRQTPLNEQLGNVLNDLGAKGNWNVPLAVHADLNDIEKLQVSGQIEFSGGELSWTQAFPTLDNIQGNLVFSNNHIAPDKLKARFLGEPMQIQGTWGRSNAKGVTIEGVVSMAAVSKLTQAPAFSMLDGRARYRAQITQNNKEGVDVSLSSSLEGLSIALPAPLGKSKETSLALSLKWSTTKQRNNNYRQSLGFTLGDILNGKLERAPDARSKSFFTQAAFSMGSAAVLPSSGTKVDLSLGEVNWSDWKNLVDKLTDEKVAAAKQSNLVLPQVQMVSIRSPRLLVDDLTFTDFNILTTQTEKGKWSARLDSKETAGSINWQESSGTISGRVVAKFTKFALGRAPTDDQEPPGIQSIDEKAWSEIPAVDVSVDDLTLFGSRLGSLRVIGSSVERGGTWNIESLEIKNPYSSLNATGQWRLKGPTRGVKLKTELAISDLGNLSSFMGYPDKVREGKGSIKADLDWLNFPWTFNYEGMGGSADVDLKEGVFEHVNSRSARLLELLSLQSLQRILSFNFRPGNEFKNGFPWQSISGNFLINQGVAKTQDLTITSPVATILLAGDSDLSRKTWNMNADVKPLFDMSGTAVATGFVVNPLIGVSALVTQFLLRNPIERAMTAKYQVRGPWDDPTLIPIDTPAPKTQGLTPNPGH